MSSKAGAVTTCVAVCLAVTAAFLSEGYQTGDPKHKLLWLLETIGAAEAATTSGAVGEARSSRRLPDV